MMVEYAEIIKHLHSAPVFDLFRLHNAIGSMLDDPNRLHQIKNLLHIGDQIEYVEASENRTMRATILNFQRTRVAVQNLDDNKRWSIPYFAINTHQINVTAMNPATIDVSTRDLTGSSDTNHRLANPTEADG